MMSRLLVLVFLILTSFTVLASAKTVLGTLLYPNECYPYGDFTITLRGSRVGPWVQVKMLNCPKKPGYIIAKNGNLELFQIICKNKEMKIKLSDFFKTSRTHYSGSKIMLSSLKNQGVLYKMTVNGDISRMGHESDFKGKTFKDTGDTNYFREYSFQYAGFQMKNDRTPFCPPQKTLPNPFNQIRNE